MNLFFVAVGLKVYWVMAANAFGALATLSARLEGDPLASEVSIRTALADDPVLDAFETEEAEEAGGSLWAAFETAAAAEGAEAAVLARAARTGDGELAKVVLVAEGEALP